MSKNNLLLRNHRWILSKVNQVTLIMKVIFKKRWIWWLNSLIVKVPLRVYQRIKKSRIVWGRENKRAEPEGPDKRFKIILLGDQEEERLQTMLWIIHWKISRKLKNKKLLKIYKKILEREKFKTWKNLFLSKEEQ